MASLRHTARQRKGLKALKYKTRYRNRCSLCARPRGYMRRFQICRICFRELALRGEIPGVRKAGW